MSRDQAGSGLIGLLIVLVIGGFITWLALTTYLDTAADSSVPGGGAPLDETRRQTTMADMRAISRAIQFMLADTGSTPASLSELQEGGYLVQVPARDNWGNPWAYTVGRDGFTLTSLGSNGGAGPAPPADWRTGAYDVDIVLRNGQFVQAPAGRERDVEAVPAPAGPLAPFAHPDLPSRCSMFA